jgi:hypothetical protein
MPPQENQSPPPDQFSQVAERLKQATNVLVTVSANPSVDQLAACIGLTLALNKTGKHATAVFSGQVPSTIGFLEPEKTLEKNTDSLRDFIISLDKSKADKLRYKVENDVVRIFITPYKTSISEKDLDFSQGDFNIDVVVALGVHERNELDQVIIAHGRILHDATVISVNTVSGPELGSINWLDSGASSLSEMTSDLIAEVGKDLLDTQISTALLTGIVAETDRFRNEKSSPHTMSVSGALMSAGASTQLISEKLEEPQAPSDEIPEVVEGGGEPDEAEIKNDGTIEISHDPDDEIHIDDEGKLHKVEELLAGQQGDSAEGQEPQPEQPSEDTSGALPSMIMEPPSIGGQLTANSEPEQYSGSSDPLSSEAAKLSGPTLSRNGPQTLAQIEESVNSPHLATAGDGTMPPLPPTEQDPTRETPASQIPPPPEPDYARDAVQRAVEAANQYQPEPIESLGATNLDLNLGNNTLPPPPVEPLLPPDVPEEQSGPPPPPVPPPLPPVS